MSTLNPFKTLVRQRCGLHLEGLAETRLVKALESLYEMTGLTTPQALISRLSLDNDLFDHLISQLTVNETYFYREPEALTWLTNIYLPQRLAEKGRPLHIFSAGCSSGEEPYSVGMALLERYGEQATQLFSITGGDVDQQVLGKAQMGVYSGMSFRALHPLLKSRYFSPEGGRFKLKEPLRQWVNFNLFNLLGPIEHTIGGPFDVILFRNVSIYFDEVTRRAIQQRLSQLLAEDGVLLCGVTETLGNDLGVLELAETQGVFYFHRPKARQRPPEEANALPDIPPVAPTTTLTTSRPGTHTSSQPLMTELPGEHFNDALHKAHTLLNQNAFDEAELLLEQLLTQQPWSVDALLLSGLVARWQQDAQLSYEYFKRAIYVAPECWPAHFYQAELFRLGELPDAPVQRQRGYSAVIRVLEALPNAKGALQAISSPIPPGDALFLAKRHLETLPATQGAG
ncbi:CheR family methyltransferase [Vreelandella olivaria]|uniref:CheR family methyltransferase n=1 Tax=Vreelandella olivaria TaxID=390919 RepID=UPI00201F220B|nr:protein-glutamate O-methyltransferase CheR [Halomonas olivaria]